MAQPPRKPGVYVTEQNAFPNSIDAVATAIPAFIGYTEKALNEDQSLHGVPRRISSVAEFHACFGAAPPVRFTVSLDQSDGRVDKPVVRRAGKSFYLSQTGQRYILYWCMRLFFDNGGGACYVTSVGSYSESLSSAALISGIHALVEEPEPTMVVVPEAVMLEAQDCIKVQQESIDHCRTLRSRVAIMDVYDGFRDRASSPDCIAQFRSTLDNEGLDFAAAYYPWLETAMVQDSDLGLANIDAASRETLKELIAEVAPPHWHDPQRKPADEIAQEALLHSSFLACSTAYKQLFDAIRNRLNQLPPSAAIAGIYAMIDSNRGVWKAPANVSVSGVIRPAVSISHEDQEDLNVSVDGRSVNAIREFPGEGALVWGARTLDGNSQDWRYINVRRTVIMLEQSLQRALAVSVLDANDADTWITLKTAARNFLTDIWRLGGLAGAAPEEAFSVQVGLGETMTAEDIQAGIVRMTVLVALARPAEFIEITLTFTALDRLGA